MFEQEDFKTGKKTVSIPVNEILPQELRKDMTATEDTDFVWNVTKAPTPASLNFGDTCLPDAPSELGVNVRVEWEIFPGIPGEVTIVTNIYAKNPAARTITVSVTDVIKKNCTSSPVALDSTGPVEVDVPANTELLVLTHIFDAPAGVSDLCDEATATYIDKITGLEVPGSTTATSSAPIQPGTQTNTTATIGDVESISGTGLTFSVDSRSGASGAFQNYPVLGVPTIGPVTWLSDEQSGNTSCLDPEGCLSGSIEFGKTVYLDQPRDTSGTLSDTATLTASDGFTASSNASVSIQSDAKVNLTITKTIPNILQGSDTVTFNFDVCKSDNQGNCIGGGYATTASITFTAGETNDSTTLTGLEPGYYKVSEIPVAGFVLNSANPQLANINLPTCGASVTFENSGEAARAQVQKVTVPPGFEGGWSFTLNGPGGPETATTAGVGYFKFNLLLQEGSYTITETGKAGWENSGPSGECSFTVNYPADFSRTFSCTYTNTKTHLKLVKTVTNDNGGTAVAADFTLSAAGPTPISGAGGADSDVNAGTYTLSETTLSGYTAGSWSCSGGTFSAPDKIALAPGDSATCTINNNDQPAHLTLVKTVINDNGGTKTVADFPLFISGTPATSGVTYPLNAGAYTASETTQFGYTASAWGGDCAANGSVNLSIGQSKTCTITNNDQPGTIIIKKISKPVNTGSFDFTTTGTGYDGFTLPGGGQNSQILDAGTYTAKELTQLGWILTGIGGSTDPNTPYNCTVTGSGGSTGVGDLNTQTATINLKIGDTVTCVFENSGQGATRTQGFWATHPQLSEIAWFGGTAFGHTFPGVASVTGIGDTLICGRPIGDLGELMGAFWSNIPRKSDGTKRSELNRTRMQLLQQLIAAELNASAFGTVPNGGSGKFAQWESRLCGTDTDAIKTAQQQAASFNSQGDSSMFTPGTSANSKYARSVADIPFWDIIKP